jgi:bifunctional oligoribonuclease and PAP phosphatase NrnA
MPESRVAPAPEERRRALRAIGERLLAARRVVLVTHVNSDGDGIGSQAAVAAWLEGRGIQATIVNPTTVPEGLRFLLYRPDLLFEGTTEDAASVVRRADLVLVLDTSEPKRVAGLAAALDRERTLVIDHHPPGPEVVGDVALQDTSAAAAGELVYDLIALFEDAIPPRCALGIYVALVSDTGSFRFSNTTPRVHQIAAELLERGIDPEKVFQSLFAIFPRRRLELLQEALASLDDDRHHGITWMVVPTEVVERLALTSEDFEGLVDHARSLQGTRVAILFRETADGGTKVSLRSTGEADVNRVARRFGGGGHPRAAGAEVAARADVAVEQVVAAVREELGRGIGD